ncbi:hypothetical protein [Flavobacterium facile]|uniref:hypothetical protein n=1 Tax=Flavobacterium facile TaxID=2893174 RepID=UPI002E75DC68|nr:hypothetical protein [Flavobacterium sp. T-12]
MNVDTLENKIGFQISFLIHSGKPIEDTIRDLKLIALEYAEQYKQKSEKWDELETEISNFYNQENESSEEENDSLLDIGEAAALAFGFI